jgi:hypothetical protein
MQQFSEKSNAAHKIRVYEHVCKQYGHLCDHEMSALCVKWKVAQRSVSVFDVHIAKIRCDEGRRVPNGFTYLFESIKNHKIVFWSSS